MKSIVFTHFKEKLLSGRKYRTFRCIFIPTYKIGEIVKIDFKENGIRETLFMAEIVEIYPKRILDVTIYEAILDGFNNRDTFVKEIMKINKIKSPHRWGFFTVFKKIDQERKTK